MSSGMISYYYGMTIVELNSFSFFIREFSRPVYIMFAGSILASLNWVSELTTTKPLHSSLMYSISMPY